MLGDIVQVLLAIVIVIILFVIAFAVYNKEFINSLKTKNATKVEVPIFSGIMDLSASKDIRYNTQDKTSANYKNLMPSHNQKAGAEFTYNFWIYTDLEGEYTMPAENDVAQIDGGITDDDLVLFVKGSKTPYTYNNVCTTTTSVQTKSDILVKCPLVKLQRGGDVLTVEFNTLSSPDAIREQARNVCIEQSTDWKYMNAHKLAVTGLRTGPNSSNYNQKWYMVTVIVQDTNPMDPLPIRNKCRCRIYVNGTMELDRYVDGSMGDFQNQSVLRQNDGDLYFAPIIVIPGKTPVQTTKSMQGSRKVMMADLIYYNYAIEPETIASKFKSGFNKNFAPVTTVSSMDPSVGANVESIAFASDKKQLMTL